MKNLKRLAVAFVLVAGIGVTMASCSDDAYYEDPEKEIPMLPETDYPTKPGPEAYSY
ncbi:hypothetical protein [uncultured Draconibacterium sp.]|uniref:hypothetical protein n=1 Tax=uncultured Draconibacterium sp. TaxID=1573823 RepID=UPI0025E55B9B|nr:hypothetical protein [uncultured Draconibacterium sp.]